MMDKLLNIVHETIKDYRNDTGIQITKDDINSWLAQFSHPDIILSELAHILPKVYLSKKEAREYLKEILEMLQTKYNYKNISDLIANSNLVDVQAEHKSQSVIIEMVKVILKDDYDVDLGKTNDVSKKHIIYLDDVLATGKTFFRETKELLSHDNLYEDVLTNKKTFDAVFFCVHQLGKGNVEWRLMKCFDDKIKTKISINSGFFIENQAKWRNQKLNFIFPTPQNNERQYEFLSKIDTTNTIPAYRSLGLPDPETFFSSSANRDLLEKEFLAKGLDIIDMITSEPNASIRPLGYTVQSHKTFGLGTMFFTWRNISNTCPLVFWWEVPGHNWKPLFPVYKRGM